MLRLLRHRRGQNTAEYAILIGLVIAAAIAMQTYVKRSLQAGTKFAVDKLQKDATSEGQYEPYYLESKYNTQVDEYIQTEELKVGGEVVRDFTASGIPKETKRSGYQKIRPVE